MSFIPKSLRVAAFALGLELIAACTPQAIPPPDLKPAPVAADTNSYPDSNPESELYAAVMEQPHNAKEISLGVWFEESQVGYSGYSGYCGRAIATQRTEILPQERGFLGKRHDTITFATLEVFHCQESEGTWIKSERQEPLDTYAPPTSILDGIYVMSAPCVCSAGKPWYTGNANLLPSNDALSVEKQAEEVLETAIRAMVGGEQ